MNVLAYFKIIRWKNLLIIAYTFYLLKFQLFPSFEIITKLSLIQFLTLLLSVLLITAAGYIINDIFDVKADLINKPSKVIVSKIISIEKANKWYLFTNTLGVVLGIILCLNIQKPSYSFIFIGTSLLLYYYAKIFKGIPFFGNFIVSFLVALSFSLVVFFDLNFEIKNSEQQTVNSVMLLLFIFAFFINLIREIIKDIEDIDGDNYLNLNTLPILFGRNRIRYLASYLCLIPILLLILILVNYAEIYKITCLYLFIFTLLPLMYIFIKLRDCKSTKQFQKISLLLKIILFCGVNSILIFSIFQ
jgi:4-hydroxybenzoate polyprenyltransferase